MRTVFYAASGLKEEVIYRGPRGHLLLYVVAIAYTGRARRKIMYAASVLKEEKGTCKYHCD